MKVAKLLGLIPLSEFHCGYLFSDNNKNYYFQVWNNLSEKHVHTFSEIPLEGLTCIKSNAANLYYFSTHEDHIQLNVINLMQQTEKFNSIQLALNFHRLDEAQTCYKLWCLNDNKIIAAVFSNNEIYCLLLDGEKVLANLSHNYCYLIDNFAQRKCLVAVKEQENFLRRMFQNTQCDKNGDFYFSNFCGLIERVSLKQMRSIASTFKLSNAVSAFSDVTLQTQGSLNAR